MKGDYNVDTTKMWDYRVVRKEYDCESGERYSVQEIYYDDDGKPMAQTIDLQVEGDTIIEMRTRLEKMINCLDQPVLDEEDITPTPSKIENKKEATKMSDGRGNIIYIYESPDGGETVFRREFGNYEQREKIKSSSKSIEDRMLELEIENTEMKDKLIKLEDTIKIRGL